MHVQRQDPSFPAHDRYGININTIGSLAARQIEQLSEGAKIEIAIERISAHRHLYFTCVSDTQSSSPFPLSILASVKEAIEKQGKQVKEKEVESPEGVLGKWVSLSKATD